MKLFIKIYAGGLDSTSSTIPFHVKGATPNDLTLADLKAEIERQITQPQAVKAKHQMISLTQSNGELVSALLFLSNLPTMTTAFSLFYSFWL